MDVDRARQRQRFHLVKTVVGKQDALVDLRHRQPQAMAARSLVRRKLSVNRKSIARRFQGAANLVCGLSGNGHHSKRNHYSSPSLRVETAEASSAKGLCRKSGKGNIRGLRPKEVCCRKKVMARLQLGIPQPQRIGDHRHRAEAHGSRGDDGAQQNAKLADTERPPRSARPPSCR